MDDDDFANISVGPNIAQSPSHELDEYLHRPIENIKEPMKWWVQHSEVYPNLSRMAMDFLSIPGESVILSMKLGLI
jgi:hAT family C-terminal dimerisation region